MSKPGGSLCRAHFRSQHGEECFLYSFPSSWKNKHCIFLMVSTHLLKDVNCYRQFLGHVDPRLGSLSRQPSQVMSLPFVSMGEQSVPRSFFVTLWLWSASGWLLSCPRPNPEESGYFESHSQKADRRYRNPPAGQHSNPEQEQWREPNIDELLLPEKIL